MLKLCDSEPLQVKVRSCLYSVCSTYTNICHDLIWCEDIVQTEGAKCGMYSNKPTCSPHYIT